MIKFDPATTFDFKPADYVPFKDRELCEKLRKISGTDLEKHTRADQHPEFNIKVMMNPHPVLIATLFSRIKEASEKGKKITLILGNPEPDTYIPLAQLINYFKVDCRNVHLFAMDEWADQDGNIAPETYARLCKIPNINSVKECNLLQLPETVKLCGDELNYYSGEDGLVHFLMSAGGLGVISVVSNIAPAYMSEMVHSYLDGDVKKAWDMQVACQDIVKALFCEVNPIPVKTSMNLLGFDVGGFRLPLCEMEEANLEKLKASMRREGLIG